MVVVGVRFRQNKLLDHKRKLKLVINKPPDTAE